MANARKMMNAKEGAGKGTYGENPKSQSSAVSRGRLFSDSERGCFFDRMNRIHKMMESGENCMAFTAQSRATIL